MATDLGEELQLGTGWHREVLSSGCKGGGGKWKKNNPDVLKRAAAKQRGNAMTQLSFY